MTQKKSARSKPKTQSKSKSKTKKPKKKLPPISKFVLYENSVQCPDWHVKHFPEFHEWLLGKQPYRLREDFCGTSRISCEWVQKSGKHTAMGLDLDVETLAYAHTENIAKLPTAAQTRVQLVQQDVLIPTKEKFDLIAACNFSFFIFHERQQLIDYFKAVYKSLDTRGTFFMEMAGGEGMIETESEQRSFYVKGYGRCQYVWDQHTYDPIKDVNDYSIHFQLPSKRWIKDAFTYHWRLWGIRELRDILMDAGFERTAVFWETEDKKGNGTGDYVPLEEAEPSHSWIAYVVGVKDPGYKPKKV